MRGDGLLLAYRTLKDVTQLGVAAAEIYRVPFPTKSSGKAYIRGISVTNTNTAAITWTLHLVPSGGSATAANQIVAAATLGVGGFIHEAYEDGEFTMMGDQSLWALASVASKVNIYIAGCEVAP